MDRIPYGRQTISEHDVQNVVQVLRSDWLTQGPAVLQFEQALIRYTGCQYAYAVCNATAALHLACLALEVGSGDIVWTSPNTFVASANCALYCGATIDFVDICPDTYNMSVDALKEKLSLAEKLGKLPKVVIPVHFAGQSCEMREIKKLSDCYGFKIIEDASHAIGGSYQGEKIGSCLYSDIAVFSFHPVKIITTGEGGVCLTNNPILAQKIALFRTHGITRDTEMMSGESEGAWYYQQKLLGFNYRITDFQCALGVSQLSQLDDFVLKRNQIAAKYNDALKNLPLKLPVLLSGNYSSYHLYVVQVLGNHKKTRKQVFNFLQEHKVGVNVHYIPVHLQPYYRTLGFSVGDFPVAEKYYKNAITLPIFPDYSQTQFSYVVSAVGAALL